MGNKITDIEERIGRSLRESLAELYFLRQEEAGHLGDVRERIQALVAELRDLAVSVDRAVKDYETSRKALIESSRRSKISEEKVSYEQASEFMKIRGSLEERYRLLTSQREELLREERRLERLVDKSERMGNRLRMVLNLLTASDEFPGASDVVSDGETMKAAFDLAEREAASFARELHDGPTQTFSAVGLMLEMGSEYLNREDTDEARVEIDKALEQVRNGLDEVRALLFALSPTGIQEGFELPLKRLAGQVRSMWECRLSFTLSGALEEVPSNVRVGAFKTLHQAVLNAARHGAREIKVAIGYVKKVLRVRITDNGKGFDVQREKKAALERGSYGLINMEDRVRMLGGELSISSTLGKGTRVSFSIPILE